MFAPTSKPTISISISSLVLLAVLCCQQTQAQTASAQFQARMAAMQQAQARASAARVVEVQPQPVRVARAPQTADKRVAVKQVVAKQVAAPAKVRQVSAPVTSKASRALTPGYQAQHTRSAQLITPGAIVDGGSPIVGSSVLDGTVVSSQPMVAEHSVVSPVVQHDSGVIYSDEVVVSDCCDSCGDSGSYFVDDCCGRGGCPNTVPCWQGPLGKALRTGSYFFGATAFRHPAYSSPVGDDLIHDCNFGAYAGFNLGIPLCRLFGGRVSGQFGMRSVNTNFNGNEFTDTSRDQLFVTAGLYRRVDYGLQVGVVVDVLAEEFYADSSIAQLRGEVSWAYPNGGAIGFRFTSSQQEDLSDGTFAGTDFTDFASVTQDHYRFFFRKVPVGGGWEELFIGWTDTDHFAVGADFDLPLTEYMALEAGAVMYLSELEAPDSNLGSTRIDDSFNLYVGFAFRPQGKAYYRSYDRPMLPVADNGTFVIRR